MHGVVRTSPYLYDFSPQLLLKRPRKFLKQGHTHTHTTKKRATQTTATMKIQASIPFAFSRKGFILLTNLKCTPLCALSVLPQGVLLPGLHQHPLKEQVASDGTGCDCCAAQIEKGARSYSCASGCDYDMCLGCFGNTINAAA
jgi:hypothetical protein